MPQRASVFCNFYIRVDREALVSERALNVGSVAFKAMSTKKIKSPAIYRHLKTKELLSLPATSTLTILEAWIAGMVFKRNRSKLLKKRQKI
jgi:hypothetical protein